MNGNRNLNVFWQLGIVATLALAGSTAHATADFSVGGNSAMSFQTAISSNLLAPYSGAPSGASLAYYNSLGIPGGYSYSTPTLTLAPSFSGETNALQMAWGTGSPTDNVVGTMQYTYGVDPDFTGKGIKFRYFAPAAIQDLSLELVDTFGRAKAWFIPLPSNHSTTWQTGVLDPSQAAQGVFTGFTQDSGFDITHVASLRYDERGTTSIALSVPPPFGTGQVNHNLWQDLSVVPLANVPEPTTMVLFGTALGLCLHRRSRRTAIAAS